MTTNNLISPRPTNGASPIPPGRPGVFHLPPAWGHSRKGETMKLKDEIRDAKAQQWDSAKWSDIRDSLEQLADEYGSSAVGPWVVVLTAFHGGGLVSRHQTATRAIERARREGIADCVCGCAGVMSVAAFDALPAAQDQHNPRELAS